MRKALTLLGIALCITALGCAKKEGSGGASGKVTIVVGGWPSGDGGFKAALAGFNERYPHINVEFEFTETGAYHQALQTALAAGQGAPDVAMIEGAYIAQYRDSTALLDLLPAPYNAGRYQNDFVNLKWDQAYSSDRKRFIAVPWDLGPTCYFYRGDIFEEAGLPSDPEEVAKKISAWDGILDVARKVNIPNKRWLLPDAVTIYQEFFMNRDFYDKQLNLMMDRPGDEDCLRMLVTMRGEKLDMSVNMWAAEAYAALGTGALVSVVTGAWYGGFLKSDIDPNGAGHWRVTLLPGNLPFSNVGGSFCAVPAQSKRKEEAWAFIEYMLASRKGQNDIFSAVDYFPALKTAWEDPIYEESDPYFGGQKTRALWKRMAAELDKPVYTTIMDTTAEDVMNRSVNASLDQGITDPGAIKKQAVSDIETATAELKRQQIQMLRDAGVWNN
ncbi:MAG: extracellular solute-binding protein [Treponema sp.]|nr:extracellular solute-binding protein [Treponema sp.]